MVNEKNIGNVKHFSKEDLRFATPAQVAKYRARRLKCKVIVDLCSGIGIQSGAFAKTCKEVYSFEIDERKVEYAKKNFDIKNLKFEVGDILEPSVVEKVRKICPDVIFCDPERLPEEKERNLNSIKPDLKKLLEVYSKITPNICLEVPPRIDLDKLKELGSFEAEYLSKDNKLNRLDLYFGNLKKDRISVVDVFSEIRIVDNKNRKSRIVKRPINYIYEVSEAIIRAGLINELATLVCAEVLEGTEKNKVLFTSKNPSLEFGCLARPYEIIDLCKNNFELNTLLKRNRFGKVVIKYSIDPKDYWKERNQLEKGLIGEREAVVFMFNQDYLVCEEYD
ncbi:RNA cap guanine-N2 methyltransferase [uncultured archaeon]|nr:RNA cap guanine-N2 methyltransferase [uncultured archaeon]